jgi:hypothetical protein
MDNMYLKYLRFIDVSWLNYLLQWAVQVARLDFQNLFFPFCSTYKLCIPFPKAAFIDTEGTFRPDRIRSIAARFGVDGDTALENIAVARAHNSGEDKLKFTSVHAAHSF